MMDWNKIVTNAVSAVVTMIVVAACTIIWKAATTVDDKVNAASESLRVVIEEVQTQIVDLQQQNNELVETINRLRTEVAKNHSRSAPPGVRTKPELAIPELAPRTIPKDNFLEQRVQEVAPPWAQQAR